MRLNAAIDAPHVPVRHETAVRHAALPLVLALAGVAYPLFPAGLYAMAAASLGPAAHILALAAGSCIIYQNMLT